MPLAAFYAFLQTHGCGAALHPGAPFYLAASPLLSRCVPPTRATLAFAAAALALLLLRCLQIALWLRAAPPLRRDGRLRVLIIGDSIPPKVDGVAVRLGHLVPALLARGHAVHIVNSKRGAPLGAAGVTQLPGFESRMYPGHSITHFNVLAALRAILAFRPHVVHLMDEGLIQAAGQMAASLCLVPTVWSHHSRLDIFGRACASWPARVRSHMCVRARAFVRWSAGAPCRCLRSPRCRHGPNHSRAHARTHTRMQFTRARAHTP